MNKNLPILSIETSGEICSAAVLLNEDEYVEMNFKQKHIHSKVLLSMTDQILKSAEIEIQQLHHVAISNGPGSFTGLRIGLSAVKGMVFGLNLPIVPVPTFDALAFQLSYYLPENAKYVIANNVNRDELYFAKYQKESENYSTLDELKIIAKNKLDTFLEPEELIFGNNYHPKNTKKISSPNAGFIAKWSYYFGNDLLTYDVDYLEPNYLKDFVIKVKK